MMMERAFYQKDYYQILGVSREATGDDIKKAYRQLALRFHPDRNPGDRQAEEHFKQVSEAYGVLIDPEKRRRYDYVSQTPLGAGQRPDFGFTQEDIFQDIFSNPMARDVFSELSREFARMGFRFDERFFDQLFFGGRGVFFGEIIFRGPGGVEYRSFGHPRELFREMNRASSPPFERTVFPQRITWKSRIFSWFFRKMVGFLLSIFLPPTPQTPPQKDDLDLTYTLPLSREEVSFPTTKDLSFRRHGNLEKLQVKIPPGVGEGTMLRLRGRGKIKGGKRGDLYLKVKLM